MIFRLVVLVRYSEVCKLMLVTEEIFWRCWLLSRNRRLIRLYYIDLIFDSCWRRYLGEHHEQRTVDLLCRTCLRPMSLSETLLLYIVARANVANKGDHSTSKGSLANIQLEE